MVSRGSELECPMTLTLTPPAMSQLHAAGARRWVNSEGLTGALTCVAAIDLTAQVSPTAARLGVSKSDSSLLRIALLLKLKCLHVLGVLLLCPLLHVMQIFAKHVQLCLNHVCGILGGLDLRKNGRLIRVCLHRQVMLLTIDNEECR